MLAQLVDLFVFSDLVQLPTLAVTSVQEAPVGHPDCLTGKTIVVSGTQDSLTRQEAEDFIKRHGGKVGLG